MVVESSNRLRGSKTQPQAGGMAKMAFKSPTIDCSRHGGRWQGMAGPSSWDPLVISAVISVSADHHVAKHFTSRRIHTGATGGSLTLWLCQQFAIENGHL